MNNISTNSCAFDFRLGIDLGGSKIEIVALDKNLQSCYRRRVASRTQSYEGLLQQICELVGDAENELNGHCSIGIGTPGAISAQTGLLRNSNTLCLNGQAFKHDIEALLGRLVAIQNDANCLALSEAVNGAGCDANVVFAVIIGTGTGAGIVVNRQLIPGRHAIAGEWGHNPMPWCRPGETLFDCYCGKSSCIETFVSGPGLARNHASRFGKNMDSRKIVERARVGDPACIVTMENYYDQLARSLAQVINILDPDVIVVGGGMSNIAEIYAQVPARLLAYVFSDTVSTPIVPALHGDASGVFGAAMLP